MNSNRPLTTMLFIPGTAQDKFANIPRIRSRAFILDLEDAVPPGEKSASRERVARVLTEQGEHASLHVRVNPIDSGYIVDDLEAIVRPGLSGIDLPKVSRPSDIETVDSLISAYESRIGLPVGEIELMATIETVAGVRSVYDIAAVSGRLRRLCFGAGDFTLDVGLDWPDGDGDSSATLLFAKVQLVLASRAAGLEAPHDSVYPRFADLTGLRREADESRALGFVGKHAIHPDQLKIIEEVYRPTVQQIERAKRLVAAFADAEEAGHGAVGVDGELVDYPILYRARQVLADAEAAEA